MTTPYRPSSTPAPTSGPYPDEPATTKMEVPLTPPPLTKPSLTAPPLTSPPSESPRFADLPASPPAYHDEDAPSAPHRSRGRHPLSSLERLLYVTMGVLAFLVVAKAVADTTDLDTNVFDALLYAALAMVVGVVVVGVGGGLIAAMHGRWQRVLDRS